MTFLELISGIESLGTLPMVHHELQGAMNDPTSPVDRIGRIIETDLDLTTRLLRLVNSPIYGFPQRIETISQAITLIGVEQISNLVSASAVVEFFHGISSGIVDMESFWRHSLACALAARNLAAQRRDPNPDRHFVAGLLHDIGRLVLYLKLPDEIPPLLVRLRSTHGLLFQIEQQMLGFDHAEIGAALLRFWRFADAQVAAVRYHHQPVLADQHLMEAALVHLADIVALALQLGHSGQAAPPPLDPIAWSLLGFPPTIFANLVSEVDRQFRETTIFFLHESH